MTADIFADRLDRVRHRFVSSLASKIDEACAAIPNLLGAIPAATAAVAEVYRSIHGIVGVGPTVGYPSTGKAARGAEDVLRMAYREGRGLTADEGALLKSALDALRDAASRELQS
jgi:chemotaxis protein histidine kinase CheA